MLRLGYEGPYVTCRMRTRKSVWLGKDRHSRHCSWWQWGFVGKEGPGFCSAASRTVGHLALAQLESDRDGTLGVNELALGDLLEASDSLGLGQLSEANDVTN